MRSGALALGAFGLLLAGCNTPHQIMDRSDFLAEATRTYKGETRERIIQAAETVLKHSDPTDFEFRYTMNGFEGLRPYVVYAVIAAANGREKWQLEVEPRGSDLVASVSISDAGASTGGYTTRTYEHKMASVPLYRLFWSRVGYVLGREPEWVTCDQAAKDLEATSTNASAALSGLCGATSDGRANPPPPQMEPLKVAPAARRTS